MTKRILIFATTYFPLVGGAEVAMKELTDRMPDIRFDLVCAKIKPGLAATEHIGNITVHRVGIGRPVDKFLLPVLGVVRALRIGKSSEIPVVWSLMASFGGFAALVYTWMRPKTCLVLTLQEGDPLEHYDKRAGAWRWLHRRIFRRANTVQAISRFLADWSMQMGFQGTPEVVPNGVDLKTFRVSGDSAARESLRKRFGFGQADTVLVTASRLSHKNAVDDLIVALTHLPLNHKVLILGTGEDEQKLRNLATEKGVSDRVVFAGTVSHADLPAHLQCGDIFVRASRSEGLGNAFLEAMACGVPIIGTPVGGIPDFLNDGDTGLLCRVNDPASIAQAVTRIQTGASLRARLIQQGRALVNEYYGWDGIAERMHQLLLRTAEGTQKTPLRILLATGIYPPDLGGPATYTHTLARLFTAQGHHVRVICYANETASMPDDPCPVTRISRGYGVVTRYVKYAQAVYRQAKGMDVVYLQGPVSEGVPGAIGAWFARRPIVMKVVGDYAWEQAVKEGEKELLDTFVTHFHTGKIRLLEALERWSARRATKVITPSRYLKKIVQAWGVPEERITVIPNAISELPNGMSREEARRTFGVEERRVLLTAVRAVPWKRGDFLISLLADLPTDVLLVVAGDGPERTHWHELAEQKGVTNRIRFLGRTDQKTLANWYRAADLFALPSGYEGYPWVVAEAASVGLPSMVSDKGGNPETKELLGAGLITVLPYDDRVVWLDALKKPWPAVGQTPSTGLPTQEQMLTDTLHTLSTAL